MGKNLYSIRLNKILGNVAKRIVAKKKNVFLCFHRHT